MTRVGCVFCLLLVLPNSGLAADDWIGLEDEPMVIGFDLSQDEDGDRSHALSLVLPLGKEMGFNGYYAKSQLSDANQEFDSLAVAASAWIELSELVDVELQYFFEGNEDELELETYGVALGLTQGEWHLRLQLTDGELFIFTRDDITDFLNSIIPNRFASDVSSYRLSLGWQNNPWYWQASYHSYEYERDLTRLDRSAFIQFIVKTAALAQSSLLISEDSSLQLGHADFDNDFSIIVSQNRSAIDHSYEETVLLGWQHWSSERLGYVLAATLPVPADNIGLTLGLQWIL